MFDEYEDMMSAEEVSEALRIGHNTVYSLLKRGALKAFRCGKIVLACATYDGFLFPPMENLLTHLKTKNFQGRTVGLMENGTWAPMAAKLMRAELDGMKNITVCENVVTIRSAVSAASEAQMEQLAEELIAK